MKKPKAKTDGEGGRDWEGRARCQCRWNVAGYAYAELLYIHCFIQIHSICSITRFGAGFLSVVRAVRCSMYKRAGMIWAKKSRRGRKRAIGSRASFASIIITNYKCQVPQSSGSARSQRFKTRQDTPLAIAEIHGLSLNSHSKFKLNITFELNWSCLRFIDETN